MTTSSQKVGFREFSFTYWLVILFEFFERGSYYGMMSILSVYFTDQLGFSKPDVGLIKGTIQPLLYFLPILAGAIADRMGYRKTLMIAFILLGSGYFLTSQVTTYTAVFLALVIMGIGAGTFKPIISGSIAKLTDERTSTLGFGIYYWSINLGAFLFPMFIVPYLKSMDWSYVMIASGICTSFMILPTIFLYREPQREQHEKKPLGQILSEIGQKIWIVFKDWRFILFVFIYSWFWILYFQMFDSVLWYMKDFVDAGPLNTLVRQITGIDWKFDIEHVTVINALTIILLQLIVSSIVRKTKALPTMVTGISLGTLGMAILAISSNIWIFLAGLFIFSIGEMTAHPKFISYLGLIAPADKKATYMGFGFLYGVFGSFLGGIIGANLYVWLIDNPMLHYIREQLAITEASDLLPQGASIQEALQIAVKSGLDKNLIAAQAHPTQLWLIFSIIGVFCISGLLLYQRLIGTGEKSA